MLQVQPITQDRTLNPSFGMRVTVKKSARALLDMSPKKLKEKILEMDYLDLSCRKESYALVTADRKHPGKLKVRTLVDGEPSTEDTIPNIQPKQLFSNLRKINKENDGLTKPIDPTLD